MSKKVCIFGSYKDLGGAYKKAIVQLGALLAQNGFTVVSGGFGGTMEDISRGAKSAGGKTIGVTYYKWATPLYKKPNEFIDREIIAGHILKRIDIMVKKSDAFIILPGGTGTFLELAAVLEYMNKNFMGFKPVIAIGDYWKPALRVLNKEPLLNPKVKAALKADDCSRMVAFLKTPQDCIKYLKKKLEN